MQPFKIKPNANLNYLLLLLMAVSHSANCKDRALGYFIKSEKEQPVNLNFVSTDHVSTTSIRDIIFNKDITKTPSVHYNKSSIRPVFHIGLAGGDYSFTAMGLSIFKRVNSYSSIGLSVHYFGENGTGSSRPVKWQKIPLTLETMVDIKKYQNERSSLFLKMGIGYSFTLNGSFFDSEELIVKKVSNGIVVNPGIGYRFNILQNTGLMIDMSYNLIVDNLKDDQNVVLSTNKWNHILFRFGVFF